MVKIKDFEGYLIEYNPDTRLFEAVKNGERVHAEQTQELLEEYIKKIAKKGFQRIKAIDVLYGEHVVVGEITSVMKTRRGYGSDYEVWFSYTENDKKSRRKTGLSNVYQATPKNMEIVKTILDLQKEKDRIEELIKERIKELKDPITPQNVYALAGLT